MPHMHRPGRPGSHKHCARVEEPSDRQCRRGGCCAPRAGAMHRLGAAIAGWKVALSSAGVIAAPILDSALLRSPARIDTRRLPKEPTLGIEAELAFRIGKPDRKS